MEQELRLIKQCIDQDRAAQKALYDIYAPKMLGLCFRYTKSLADAEDVLQEGFVRVFTHLQQYKQDGPPGAWIRKVMVTTALNFLKSNARYRSEMVFDKTDLHPVSDENPELLLHAKELASLIQQLPTGYQTIFNLHAIEGYAHTEIAALLGISDGTSRSQYARARALLITWLKKNYADQKIQNYAR